MKIVAVLNPKLFASLFEAFAGHNLPLPLGLDAIPAGVAVCKEVTCMKR